jgi:hypothetical protein
MATLVLTTIGRAVAGPLGAIGGALAGNALDRALLGSPGRRPGPAELAIQGANYGDPLQRLYGRIRAGGQLIWSTGLQPRNRSGKGGAGRAWGASFAVALSARPIAGVGRIWADGRLIRDASGTMSVPGRLRIHAGLPDQAPDPLIAAAEGTGGTPAYRGLAYAVFEELALEPFGNRIPTLSFEVIADATPPRLDAIVRDLFAAGGEPQPTTVGLADRSIPGFAVPAGTSLERCIDQLGLVEPLVIGAERTRVAPVVRADAAPVAAGLTAQEIGAAPGSTGRAPSEEWLAAQVEPTALAIIYLDEARDMQPGLQRSIRRGRGQERREALPLTLSASEAKAIAQRQALEQMHQRKMRRVTVPVRLAVLDPGDCITIDDEPGIWRVRRSTFAGMVVELLIEAVEADAVAPAMPAEPGRPAPNPLLVQGPTRLEVIDLPALPWEQGQPLRLVAAAAGTGPGWRRAELLASLDGGASWSPAGSIEQAAIIGDALDALLPGPADRWDERSMVDVILHDPEGWLEPMPRQSVLAGANLALLGNELIHFAHAHPLGAGQFRLSGLLRGRYGTEPAMTGHVPGERFILLEPDALARIPMPQHLLGGQALIKAVGPLEDPALVAAVSSHWAARVLRPWAPCRLTARRLPDGSVDLAWTERGREHLAWPDGQVAVGLPFRIEIVAGSNRQSFEVAGETLTISLAEQLARFGAPLGAFTVSVTQLHPLTGAGDAAAASITLSD